MMVPFVALIKRDLLVFFADRRAVLMSLVAPIVLGSFFGYLFGGQSGKTETSRIQILIIDDDGSDISRELGAKLGSDKNLDVKPSTLDDARAAVRKGKATLAIEIPKNFGDSSGKAFFGRSTKPLITVLRLTTWNWTWCKAFLTAL
ncbi:MAG: linearmycin/streptolysin transport system permease protein [Acidobacteriaceae bacterium]|jgi:ABC-2 type transport system permease protein